MTLRIVVFANLVLALGLVGSASAQGTFPQACGAGAADMVNVPRVGTAVMLGRHRPAPGTGHEFWVPEMQAYVGRIAIVTSARAELDTSGCVVVHVDADRGEYLWRVRDILTLGPQACGATVPAAPLRVGTRVRLGRHRATGSPPDANWASDMDAYVGRDATITGITELDGSGCPTVRVDVDRGGFFWRVRDMGLVGAGAPAPVVAAAPYGGATGRLPNATLLPSRCDGTARFGSLSIGARVILSHHIGIGSPPDENWDSGMDGYVGRTASVRELVSLTDPSGCTVVHVDVDGGDFYWRVRDLVVVR